MPVSVFLSERVAPQQIINRLQGELAKTKQSLALLESDMSNKEDLDTNFEQKLIMLTKENNLLTEEIQSLRQTIEEMKNSINLETDEIHRQIDDLIAQVKMPRRKHLLTDRSASLVCSEDRWNAFLQSN
jgi:hypothetical protein